MKHHQIPLEDDQDELIYHIKHTISSELKVPVDKVNVVWSDVDIFMLMENGVVIMI